MGIWQNIISRIYPRRASTHTWMMLTFALFVGTAVFIVGLYVLVILRSDIHDATEDMLFEQADRVASQVQQAGSPEEQRTIIREMSRLTDLRITLIQGDRLLIDAYGNQTLRADSSISESEINSLYDEHQSFSVFNPEDGERMFFVARLLPEQDQILRIGQPVPALYTLAQRAMWILVFGMLMGLILALLGSLVAAMQVLKPLKTIQESARRVSEGEFEGRVTVKTRAAEFQDLAHSLNHASLRFRKKIDELERLTQLQSEFIGNVSHEVRNPIFAISGYLEALATARLGDDQRKKYAEKALTNLQRLNTLFDDLIEIARLEYREDLIRASVFSLQDLIDEVADMLRPKADDKGLDFEVHNPDIHVRADRTRIRQVLTNLMDNAISYTDEGSVRCRVRRRVDKVRIEVVDTGRGIDEDHLERIFERFYRVESDRARKSGGTGLGLSIVKQILQAHGQSIHVESTLGRGTRFWFELEYVDVSESVEFVA